MNRTTLLSADLPATTAGPCEPPRSRPFRVARSKPDSTSLAAVAIDAVVDQHLPHLRLEQAQPLLHLLGMGRIDFGLGLIGLGRRAREGDEEGDKEG